MKKLVLLLFIPYLHAMQEPKSPLKSPKSATPQEISTVVTLRLFDRADGEIIKVLSDILTRDRQSNRELVELRYRMVTRIQQEMLQCGESR